MKLTNMHEPPIVWTSSTRITQGFLDLTGIIIQKAWDILNMICQVIL